jgi:xylose isomerase
MSIKLATGLWVYSSMQDRFCLDGYRETPRLPDVISALAKLKGLKGVEIQQTDITPEMPVKEVKRLLKDNGLVCSAVSTSLSHSRRFSLAGFAQQHQRTRNAAIDEGRKAVEIARALGTTEVVLRLFTDGFDYPFHVDYTAHWNTIISSIKTIAKFASPDVNISVVYKPREPRKYLAISSVGKALSLCQEIAMKNVGVALNFSHALMAGENPAESIAFLNRSSKLFQVYISDCYAPWDDLMIPGSLHLWETLEALFYLKNAKHKGFVTIDIQPQRMDPNHALQLALGNIAILWKKLERLDATELRKAQRTLNAVESQRIIRRILLQG